MNSRRLMVGTPDLRRHGSTANGRSGEGQGKFNAATRPRGSWAGASPATPRNSCGLALGGGTGEDRDVATAVLVLVFDAPLAGGIAVFQQPDLGMEVVLNGVISVVLGAFEPPSLGRVHGGDEFGEGSGAICHGTAAGGRA